MRRRHANGQRLVARIVRAMMNGRRLPTTGLRQWDKSMHIDRNGVGGRLGTTRSGLRSRQESVGRRGLEWGGDRAQIAALRDPRNADIQNYIGYAYRRLSQLGRLFRPHAAAFA